MLHLQGQGCGSTKHRCTHLSQRRDISPALISQNQHGPAGPFWGRPNSSAAASEEILPPTTTEKQSMAMPSSKEDKTMTRTYWSRFGGFRSWSAVTRAEKL